MCALAKCKHVPKWGVSLYLPRFIKPPIEGIELIYPIELMDPKELIDPVEISDPIELIDPVEPTDPV